MSKRQKMDKAQARERRNRLRESAAAAELSLTEGVREMRAISGMTQEEFARHRGVSARVIKALELDQGNPTVATLNRIGEFFGLEVGFVPIKRVPSTATEPQPAIELAALPALTPSNEAPETQERIHTSYVQLKTPQVARVEWESEAAKNEFHRAMFESLEKLDSVLHLLFQQAPERKDTPKDTGTASKPLRTKKRTRPS